MVGRGDAGDHGEQQDHRHDAGVGVNRHFNYARYFSMVPVGPEGREGLLAGLLRACGRAAAEAANRRDPGGRCRIRQDLGRRRARKRRRLRLQDRLRQELSAAHDRFRADRARDAGGQCRRRLRRRLSAGHRRHRARRARDRPDAEDVRRHHDRAADHADQDAARSDDRRPRHHGKLRAGADLRLPRALPTCSSAIAQWRRAKRSIRSATASCRSAMRPDKFWRRR